MRSQSHHLFDIVFVGHGIQPPLKVFTLIWLPRIISPGQHFLPFHIRVSGASKLFVPGVRDEVRCTVPIRIRIEIANAGCLFEPVHEPIVIGAESKRLSFFIP